MTYYTAFGPDGFSTGLMNTRPETPEGETPLEIFEVDDSLANDILILDAEGVIRAATEDELKARIDALQLSSRSAQTRHERDLLLADSDKLVGADRWSGYTTTVKGKISAYRQALRDLPSQEGFPDNVTWPEAP